MIEKLKYTNSHELIFLDQTLLPKKEKYVKTKNYEVVVDAIMNLKIRGAPLIGIAAAYAVVLGLHYFKSNIKKNLQIHFYKLIDTLKNTRPTAKNLFYSLSRLQSVFEQNIDDKPENIEYLLLEETDKIYEEDIEMCNRIAVNGVELITDNMNILTHCNTGELATGGIGTAMGIITKAHQLNKNVFVYVNETRPLLQGARLTAYELKKNNIPFELIIDSTGPTLMKEGLVDCVLVGADRIASNGDVVNKIGSYSLAVNCAYHKIPFYVSAPSTTIDFDIESGNEIQIEERPPEEVSFINGKQIAPTDINILNPAFDFVPYKLVSAIITEYKIHYPPYDFNKIKHLFQ